MNKIKGRRNSWIVIAGAVLLLLLSAFTALVGWGPTKTGSVGNVRLGLDLSGGVSVTYQAKEENPSAEDMKDTVYKLQKRVENYSTEARVYQEGPNRINVEIPGEQDADAVLAELGKPGALKFKLEDGTVVLDGSRVVSAEPASQRDEMGNAETVVELKFDDEGSKAFQKATGEHVGEAILIEYDGEVISAPTVKSEIAGGSAVITGMSGREEAESLSSFIRIGSLSLELEELRSNVVGAELGENALRSSLIAGAIGIALIILIMISAYRVPGAVAGFVLLLYAALDAVLLNAFDMTLTLPGIAGIILSIGMAVDANVIVYSRIREEISAGASPKGAINSGFRKSLSAVIDGSVTTVIAALVLNFMGTGSVKGFAQTLMLGVVLSAFTALVVSRAVMTALCELGVSDPKWYGKARIPKTIDFVGKRRFSIAIACAAVLIGFGAMAANSASGNGPLNLSMDFLGGTSAYVRFGEEMSLQELEKEAIPVFEEAAGTDEVRIQKTAGSADATFKTKTLERDERSAVENLLTEKFNLKDGAVSFETVSSAISGEMRRDAVIAVVIAVLLMLVYIRIRFLDLGFAAASVIALIHDVLVALACYAVVRIPVGGTFIACMLTILGYSINATIVIFDRIRENLKTMKGAPDAEIVNLSVSQTMTRSVYTTATTFAATAALFIFGAPTVKEFALPLSVGVIAGCFSSVCLAGPIWHLIKSAKKSRKTA